MFSPALLFAAPAVNPITKKAQSIPALNPVNTYGRVFFFSWLGFLVAFLSWYAFPPLLSDIIAKDLGLSTVEVANSNIIALTATLLVRLISGPCCDRFGPRLTFVGILLVGAIPTFLSGTAHSAAELYALRFFIGILGGAFVPCQVWTTAFFDKKIVGTANALTAGLGNSGGGITYFVMPAVYDSLVGDGLPSDTAWRVAFVVPGIIITIIAIAMLLLCPDTPTGRWSDRVQAAENNLREHNLHTAIVDVPGQVSAEKPTGSTDGTDTPKLSDEEKKLDNHRGEFGDNEVQLGEQEMLDTARGEVVQKPSVTEVIKVIFTPQTLVLGASYMCTFGSELAINSILGTWIGAKHPNFGTEKSGSWAAMFGLMNIIFRPAGGLLSDFLYRRTKTLWAKKALVHVYGVLMGVFWIAVGATDPSELGQMVGLLSIGGAFFMQGSNGGNYSLLPHVLPSANGIVAGFTGASGNFGGIIFAIIFRYNTTNYGRSLWIIGVIAIAVHLAVCWIRPIPKGQIGGR